MVSATLKPRKDEFVYYGQPTTAVHTFARMGTRAKPGHELMATTKVLICINDKELNPIYIQYPHHEVFILFCVETLLKPKSKIDKQNQRRHLNERPDNTCKGLSGINTKYPNCHGNC